MKSLAVLVFVCEAAAAVTDPELVASVARRLNVLADLSVESATSRGTPAKEEPPEITAAVTAADGTTFMNRLSALLREEEKLSSSTSQKISLRRGLQPGGAGDDCDSAFMNCLTSDGCVDCFLELETKQIDWATVSKDTPCSDVTKVLIDNGHCSVIARDRKAFDTFCETFDICIDVADANGGNNNNNNGSELNCNTLTECLWEGMHPQWIGDGICHDGIGCYNSEVCGYDDGDCCPDTCKTPDASFTECGHEGYVCRDPKSANCEKGLNPKCVNDQRTKPPMPTCPDGTTLYRMVMYDSFGDGWDGTRLTIADTSSLNALLYTLELKDGSQGTEYICLNKSPTCYRVEVKGGTWGREVSWEVKPLTEGAPALASGGSPMSCDFGVAGSSCTKTCTGRTTEDPTKDPDYKQFKTMSQCINTKCPIQIGACEADKVCIDCFRDIPADYCYADDTFNALLNCAICKCTDSVNADFCEQKMAPGRPVEPGNNDDGWTQDPCSPAETVKGGNAVLRFGKCTDMEEAGMMVTDFDQNNFGMLDRFEACAHAWKNKPDRGGNTALGCLQILLDAKNGKFGNDVAPSAPKKAIQALASHLYDNPHEFCECASNASTDCPLCPSFMNFKTLLYESLDACQSLDEIDCDAGKDFFPKCRENLLSAKGSVDFSKPDQCSYVKDGCGNAGPFPVFRNLDCDKEVAQEAWDFYLKYSNACLKDEPSPPTPSPPTPTPVAPTPPSPGGDTTPTSPTSPTDKKPYIPPEDRGKDKKNKKDKKKKESTGDGTPEKESHFLRNMFWLLLIAGGLYYYHKKYGFDLSFFQRYRRFRPVSSYDQGGEMYSGLTMESSTNFQPPTLPPTPMDLGGAPPNNGGHYI